MHRISRETVGHDAVDIHHAAGGIAEIVRITGILPGGGGSHANAGVRLIPAPDTLQTCAVGGAVHDKHRLWRGRTAEHQPIGVTVEADARFIAERAHHETRLAVGGRLREVTAVAALVAPLADIVRAVLEDHRAVRRVQPIKHPRHRRAQSSGRSESHRAVAHRRATGITAHRRHVHRALTILRDALVTRDRLAYHELAVGDDGKNASRRAEAEHHIYFLRHRGEVRDVAGEHKTVSVQDKCAGIIAERQSVE